MERKVFTVLFLIIFDLLGLAFMSLSTTWMVNYGGTIGMVVCPFVQLGLGFGLFKLNKHLLNRNLPLNKKA